MHTFNIYTFQHPVQESFTRVSHAMCATTHHATGTTFLLIRFLFNNEFLVPSLRGTKTQSVHGGRSQNPVVIHDPTQLSLTYITDHARSCNWPDYTRLDVVLSTGMYYVTLFVPIMNWSPCSDRFKFSYNLNSIAENYSIIIIIIKFQILFA